MMMDCPRCGLEQPKDRYCASCGLDVEQFLRKPKPLWVRLVQNPNLHLSLIGILIVIVIGYIFYLQRGVMGRRVDALFKGTPLSSREAGDPNAPARQRSKAPAAKVEEEKVAETVSAEAVAPPAEAPAPAPAAVVEPTKVEVSHWEIPRDILASLLSGAEKLSDGNGGRAYFWSQGSKIVDDVEKNSRPLSMLRTASVDEGAEIRDETASAAESFQFGMYFKVSKNEGKDPTIKWDFTMILPPAETPADAAAPRQPVVKALNETKVSGSSALKAQSAVLIVVDPANRSPRKELVLRGGDGPWAVLTSEPFRADTTDWVILIQPKGEKKPAAAKSE